MLPQLLFKELKQRANMPDEDFDAYCSLFSRLAVRANDFIYKPGDVAGHILFVGKGCVHVYAEPLPGTMHTLYFAEEGWWTGDLVSMRNQQPTDQYFEALEDSEFLIMSLDNWNYALRRFQWFASFHLEAHSKWLAKLSKQLDDRRDKSADETFQQLAAERPKLLERLPDARLASYLGVPISAAGNMKLAYLQSRNA